MQALRQFSIPFKGLKLGKHSYSFEVLNDFFNAFEDSPIKKGNLMSTLELNRKPDHIDLVFQTSGTIETECDRCTSIINLPIDSESNYIIKFEEDEREEDEVIYIHPEQNDLNVAKIIYEHIILSIPIIKVFDCDEISPLPCNQKVLAVLNNEKSENLSNNPFGEVFKDLKITTKTK